ncbi:MAG: ABC transporter ATP-binding protein [Pseudobdellovibrionaceae bacterium]
MYSIDSFSVEVKPRMLIRPQNLSLPQVGLILVVGANGVGKTTFLKQVGRRLLRHKKETKISFVSSIQVYEKGLLLSGHDFFKLFSNKKWPSELMTRFGHLLKKRIDQMSSGEFQALVLISNFMEDSDIVLVDEPVSHLSHEWALFFIAWVRELKNIKLLITVSHQTELLSEISDQIYEIKNQSLMLKYDALQEGYYESI